MKAKSGSLDFSAIQLQMQLCCYNRKARDRGGKERGQSCFFELKQCALVAKRFTMMREQYALVTKKASGVLSGQWFTCWPRKPMLFWLANS